ncbi:cob(I)yrinic acid a,c-diamide adenosyltransferase [Elusimicrobiota bacterium]
MEESKDRPVPIYTRTGDNGTTGTLTGKRVPKQGKIIEAIGSTDEAASILALARTLLLKEKYPKEAAQVQRILFALHEIGTLMALEGQSTDNTLGSMTKDMEKFIDNAQKGLPPLKHFIIPGNSPAPCAINHARSIVRRMERRIVEALGDAHSAQDALMFANRLSDYLFILTRWIMHKKKEKEIILKK